MKTLIFKATIGALFFGGLASPLYHDTPYGMVIVVILALLGAVLIVFHEKGKQEATSANLRCVTESLDRLVSDSATHLTAVTDFLKKESDKKGKFIQTIQKIDTLTEKLEEALRSNTEKIDQKIKEIGDYTKEVSGWCKERFDQDCKAINETRQHIAGMMEKITAAQDKHIVESSKYLEEASKLTAIIGNFETCVNTQGQTIQQGVAVANQLFAAVGEIKGEIKEGVAGIQLEMSNQGDAQVESTKEAIEQALEDIVDAVEKQYKTAREENAARLEALENIQQNFQNSMEDTFKKVCEDHGEFLTAIRELNTKDVELMKKLLKE